MKKLAYMVCLFACSAVLMFVPDTQAQIKPIENPRIFIAPQNGFETYLAGAFTKKSVPAQIVMAQDAADYILQPAPVVQKLENTGGKIARCLFAYCAGIEGSQTASVSLVDTKTEAVVWAYNVKKGGSNNLQTSAEACAKHLKHWLDTQVSKSLEVTNGCFSALGERPVF